MAEEPEVIKDPILAGEGEDISFTDASKRPLPEHIFVAFRNEVQEHFEKIDTFLEVQKAQENAGMRDVALDIPKDIKVGRRTFKLHRLPAGYRVLMMQRLQQIAELVPRAESPPIEKLAELLVNKDEKAPEQLAQDLIETTRQPGLLSRIMPSVPAIFDLMLEVVQLAFQAGRGKPEFDDNGKLKEPTIDIDVLRWDCADIEGIFNDIISMNIPIFFTIQTVGKSLSV